MLKDDDEGSDSDGGDFESVTPEHESRILEEHVTPSITERHTRILEDVDGELEMEDVAPPWEAGSSAIADRAYNTESANCQLVSGTSHQNVTSSSPPQPRPPPPAPSSQNGQSAMSDSYSNGFGRGGYPSMHVRPFSSFRIFSLKRSDDLDMITYLYCVADKYSRGIIKPVLQG